MTIAIIDYGSGNLRSAAKAFERAAAELGLAVPVVVTARAEDVDRADHVVLPGVGAFGDCRRGLAAVPGMVEALTRAVLVRGRPFLGICVGMQLLATVGREHGNHPGLDWIPGEVVGLAPAPADPALKVPHMGWNSLELRVPDHPVFRGLPAEADCYFVHSYAFVCKDPGHVLATVEYGGEVTAVVGRDTMIGTQFHPEKSQDAGLRFIANFLQWRP